MHPSVTDDGATAAPVDEDAAFAATVKAISRLVDAAEMFQRAAKLSRSEVQRLQLLALSHETFAIVYEAEELRRHVAELRANTRQVAFSYETNSGDRVDVLAKIPCGAANPFTHGVTCARPQGHTGEHHNASASSRWGWVPQGAAVAR